MVLLLVACGAGSPTTPDPAGPGGPKDGAPPLPIGPADVGPRPPGPPLGATGGGSGAGGQAFGVAPHVRVDPPTVVEPVPVTGPPVPGGTCPTGMVPVPTESPRYCIDAYEVEVKDGVAYSRPGVRGAVGLNFDAARLACARAPVVDAKGKVRGQKRMALASEWEDAADGTVGPGGLRYPFGNVPDSTKCVTVDATGQTTWREPRPGGAATACVSPFGAYDMLGNLWEWTDSGFRANRAQWLVFAANQGLSVTIDPDDRIRVGERPELGLELLMNDVDPSALHRGPDGALQLHPNERRAKGNMVVRAGFLVPSRGEHLKVGDLLPVEVAPEVAGHPEGEWAVYWRASDEGTAIPDKRGCAHYTGSIESCPSSAGHLGHTRDFSGSIGFRCVSDPIPP